MSVVSLRQLIEAGVHFGHRTSRWNPKMERYIYGRRNLIHIINLKETAKGLVRARNFLYNLTSEGGTVLFVATKRQAKDVVREMALSCEMPYATERWLGGMLTNYSTIRSRLKTLEELEQLVATGEIETHSKKMQATINRNIRKLRRNLDGVRHMTRVPDAVIIIDPRREDIALKEAHKLKLATVCILDTDCDPDHVDICIPANDDAMRSVRILSGLLAEAVGRGRLKYEQKVALEKKKAEEKAAVEREAATKRQEAEAKKKADQAAVKAALKAREEAAAKARASAAKAEAPKAKADKPETPAKDAKAKAPAKAKEPAAEKPKNAPAAPTAKETEAKKPAKPKAAADAKPEEPKAPADAKPDESEGDAKVEVAETA